MDGLAIERIGLDFSDELAGKEFCRLLEFAQFELVNNLADAKIIFGDRSSHGQKGVLYIGVDVADGRYPFQLKSPITLDSLLATLATAVGSLDDDEYGINPSALSYVGLSNDAVQVRRLISRAAQRDVTVLVTGESGTGKEVVAKSLHQGSSRASGPFIPVNCGAIPNELLESELFGHEKGAFSGAIAQKAGRFELAHGGTLFLDEIGDMPFTMQVKLLRAIEERSFERVGGVKSLVSDVRIVAATNQNLEEKISAGQFREDLYYRLNVFPVELSPLRRRSEDLPMLISVIMERIQAEQHLHVRFSLEALAALAQYPWPGNVRELGNLLQRLVIQYPNSLIRSVDLPKKYTQITEKPTLEVEGDDNKQVLLPVNGIDLKDYLTRLERSLIEQALQDTNAVVARAADRLHIRRTTLVEKMRKHGLGRALEGIQ